MTTTSLSHDNKRWFPRCIASSANGVKSDTNVAGALGALRRRFFREAQWSADGTTLVTQSDDNGLHTYVLPVELLNDSQQPHNLGTYDTWRPATHIQSYAINPHFRLEEPATTLVLSALNDLPISLNYALQFDHTHAHYPWIDPRNEAYIAPSSLTWMSDGLRFVAGGKDQIAIFDASRPGEGPCTTSKTGPGRKQRKLYGSGGLLSCKGIISALALGSRGILASGTLERQIALFDQEGLGACMTTFSLVGSTVQESNARGAGVTKLQWSDCGTYLLIAERKSDCIQVYDVRSTMRRVAKLTGRKANTSQRLGFEVIPSFSGPEAWAGGTDGCLRLWNNVGSFEGDHGPDLEIDMSDDVFSSVTWHPQGAVLATTFGSRDAPSTSFRKDEFIDEGVNTSLQIWDAPVQEMNYSV